MKPAAQWCIGRVDLENIPKTASVTPALTAQLTQLTRVPEGLAVWWVSCSAAELEMVQELQGWRTQKDIRA